MPYIITKNVNIHVPKGEYRTLRTLAQKTQVSMSGWSDWLVEVSGGVVGINYDGMMKQLAPAVERGCLNQANVSNSVAQLDANIADIASQWKPSGFYSPAQITAIVNMVLPMIISAQAQITGAPDSTSDAQTVKGISSKDLKRKLDEAAVFTKGANDAIKASIAVVESQGLRKWVLNALTTVSQAYVTVATLRCHTTYLDTVNSSIQAVGRFLKGLANIAVGIGETILKIPDTVATIWSIAKWAAIAGAGYYVYREYVKK